MQILNQNGGQIFKKHLYDTLILYILVRAVVNMLRECFICVGKVLARLEVGELLQSIGVCFNDKCARSPLESLVLPRLHARNGIAINRALIQHIPKRIGISLSVYS
jgi:hypothetical protein